MDVSDDRYRRLYVYDIALLHKQFLRLSAHRFDDRVGQELLAVEAFDTFIQIYAGYMDDAVSWVPCLRATRVSSTYQVGRALLRIWRWKGCRFPGEKQLFDYETRIRLRRNSLNQVLSSLCE
jgi:hypothetical protein